jgi:CRP-like cAMP-binding protein
VSSPVRGNNKNQLLARHDPERCARLLDAMQPVVLRRGVPLYEAGQRMRYVWFPTTAVVSLVFGVEDGAATEVIVAGRDSMIGAWEIMGGGSSPGRALVQQAGHALRMRQELFRREFDADPQLRELVQRYFLTFLVQAAYTAVCNRYHTLAQQLARALLMRHDRIAGDKIQFTQEMLAYVLGVRRPGVTAAAKKLQQQGLIDYRRGCIVVVDRGGLESLACSCYAAITGECTRLMTSV